MQYWDRENGLREINHTLGETTQSNVSWHVVEALGTLDNVLTTEYFFSRSKDLTAIIIVFKTSPFCKTYSTNDTSSGNPRSPLNWIKVRWDTRQSGTLVCGAHPKIGYCCLSFWIIRTCSIGHFWSKLSRELELNQRRMSSRRIK